VSLDISQPYGPSRSVIGIALPFTFFLFFSRLIIFSITYFSSSYGFKCFIYPSSKFRVSECSLKSGYSLRCSTNSLYCLKEKVDYIFIKARQWALPKASSQLVDQYPFYLSLYGPVFNFARMILCSGLT
jgi:hypothetical protein